jgi:hypothetical protein
VKFRWRTASPMAAARGCDPGECDTLAAALMAAESFILTDSNASDVALVFQRVARRIPEWAPVAAGVHSGDAVRWQDWPNE